MAKKASRREEGRVRRDSNVRVDFKSSMSVCPAQPHCASHREFRIVLFDGKDDQPRVLRL